MIISVFVYAWHQFTGHYIDIGKAEVQAEWDIEAAATAKAVLALEKQDSDNRLAAEKKTAALIAGHTETLNTLKDHYEKTHHTDVATISDLRGRMRGSMQDIASRVQASEGESDTSQLAEGGGNCDATIIGRLRHDLAEVSLACAITTEDYNTLRAWGDTNCQIFGCE
ncbi:MAG: hypothetical protein ACAH07_06075 [Methylophilaceae bacterium]|nr:hypothetical protein [Methyloradius sp.]